MSSEFTTLGDEQSTATELDRDVVESRPKGVVEIEDEWLTQLISFTEQLAPHMNGSFIVDKRWWNEHREMPASHVSCSSINGSSKVMMAYL